MKEINIKIIRKKLDKVDIKLLKIIKERSVLVDQVIKLKKTNEQEKNEILLKKYLENKVESNKIKTNWQHLQDN